MIRAAFMVLSVSLLAGCAGSEVWRDRNAPIAAVDSVDLTRYAGTWYEIARFPVWFQEDCAGVTAKYALREDGRVDVVNTCREGGLDGPVRSADAIARAVDDTNAKLKVNFAAPLPFEGDYWVLYLDEDYQVAVVGSPGGQGGWILSRTPQIEADRLEAARGALAANGYDVGRLTFTEQPAG